MLELEISGYAFSELLGKSHNVVRHSDVPPAVFKDLWETLKRGECWRGVVKNRAKSGRYYWVDACVTPIFEDRKIVGYSSIDAPDLERLSELATTAAERMAQVELP